MSGVKWDSDLGRKCRFGASTRKVEAELQWKNPKWHGLFLTFLKINDNASVSNNDIGKNKSGEAVKFKCYFSSDEIVHEYCNCRNHMFKGASICKWLQCFSRSCEKPILDSCGNTGISCLWIWKFFH
jgi:hypothetical protein